MDIDRKGTEEQEWIPKIDKKGNVSYEMEEGDSAKTLASQFGLSQDVAKQIMPEDLKPGQSISGEQVKAVTGSDILKLDLTNKDLTDQDIAYQIIFSIRKEIFNDKIDLSNNVKPDYTLALNNYFSHIKENTDKTAGGTFYGFGTSDNRFTNISLYGNISVGVKIDLHTMSSGFLNPYINNERQLPNNNIVFEFFHASKGKKYLPMMTIQTKINDSNALYNFLMFNR